MAESVKCEGLPLGGAVSRHSFSMLASYAYLVMMTQRLTERGHVCVLSWLSWTTLSVSSVNFLNHTSSFLHSFSHADSSP